MPIYFLLARIHFVITYFLTSILKRRKKSRTMCGFLKHQSISRNELKRLAERNVELGKLLEVGSSG